MATRGAKPKPAKLRLVDETHRENRHGKNDQIVEATEAVASAFGPLVKPACVRGRAATAWDKYIKPAAWLDGSREAAAIAFCELWKEFQSSPAGFSASKHGQLRAYMAELGLTDERNRGDYGRKKEEDDLFD